MEMMKKSIANARHLELLETAQKIGQTQASNQKRNFEGHEYKNIMCNRAFIRNDFMR